MLLRLVSLGVLLAVACPARAGGRDLPGDIAAELENAAARLDASLAVLEREAAFRDEVLRVACELRLAGLVSVTRGVPDAQADRLRRWAGRLERAATDRKKVRSVCDEITGVLDLRRLRGMAEELLATQKRIGVDIQESFWARYPGGVAYEQVIREPKIGELPLVVVAKGKPVRLEHAILWRQYPEEELEIEVTASSPAVRVPKKLKLEFEKHPQAFEYELVAEAVGEYVVVLIPAAGERVKVFLSVRDPR